MNDHIYLMYFILIFFLVCLELILNMVYMYLNLPLLLDLLIDHLEDVPHLLAFCHEEMCFEAISKGTSDICFNHLESI